MIIFVFHFRVWEKGNKIRVKLLQYILMRNSKWCNSNIIKGKEGYKSNESNKWLPVFKCWAYLANLGSLLSQELQTTRGATSFLPHN